MAIQRFEVPASTAHLGPGFGILGLALDRTFRVTFESVDAPDSGVDRAGEPSRQLDARHDAVLRAADAAREAFDPKRGSQGLRVSIEGEVPRRSGLGSNSADFAAGVAAIVRELEDRPPDDALLDVLVGLGADPAHGAAALFGGLVLTVPVHAPNAATRYRLVRMPIDPDWRLAIVVPELDVGTADVHRVVPPTLPHVVAQRTAGRLSLLLTGLANGDEELVRDGITDESHVPFRTSLAPGLQHAMEAANDTGAIATISGHGPAIAALARSRDVAVAAAERMVSAFESASTASHAILCRPRAAGALALDDVDRPIPDGD